MRSFLAALSLITCCPLGRFLPAEKELHRCSNYFPVVGLLAGALIYFPALWASEYLGAASAVLILLMMEGISKGFHLDGLADTADGFLSSRPRERKLEIMHDSHIGTMGVAAIVLILLAKYSCLSSMEPKTAAMTAALSVFAGRFALTFYILISRYARESGLGKILYSRRPWGGALAGLVISVVASYYFFGNCFFILPTLVFIVIWNWICIWHIRGATGDTIGACEQLTETLICFQMLFLS